MTVKKSDVAVLAICALSLAGLAALMPFLPETIPTHWNFRSEPDSWGPRWTILAMGALPLAIWLLMRVVPLIDPRRESFERHRKSYGVLSLAITAALTPIAWIVALSSLGYRLDVGIIVRVIIGLLFLVIGNYLGKIRPNYFVGIRTPWTLSDPEVWKKTHRRGAWAFVAMGLCMLASIAVPHSAAAGFIVLASVLGGVAYIFVYSYLEYRKAHRS